MLVVGAGPAGSVAARVAAAAGVKTIILERKAELGLPVRCAGYVAETIRWHVDLPSGTLAQSVAGLRTLLPDGSVQEMAVPGYTINRAALDRHLAIEAVEAGAELFLKTTAVDRVGDRVLARQSGRELLIRPGVIIGADGPLSLVARWMGLARPQVATAIQYDFRLSRPLSIAEVYFRSEIRGGYAWLFPAGEVARIGVAFAAGAREAMAGFRSLLRKIEDEGKAIGPALSVTGGLVPIGGPTALRRGNMLLVGDAAGLTHPMTGAGILNAIIAGEIAGLAASKAVLAGRLDYLEEYEEECHFVLGPGLRRAGERRRELDRHWQLSPAGLSQAIRRSWLTFDEYYSG
ncbi:MAG: NAD(P)/FAD-dependent oxidoreductase [Dehalococcoidia bacterium]|nr:NAD(P)/FAD-dependent oxidoreductase [Dehalococcoidia bacterium]